MPHRTRDKRRNRLFRFSAYTAHTSWGLFNGGQWVAIRPTHLPIHGDLCERCCSSIADHISIQVQVLEHCIRFHRLCKRCSSLAPDRTPVRVRRTILPDMLPVLRELWKRVQPWNLKQKAPVEFNRYQHTVLFHPFRPRGCALVAETGTMDVNCDDPMVTPESTANRRHPSDANAVKMAKVQIRQRPIQAQPHTQ